MNPLSRYLQSRRRTTRILNLARELHTLNDLIHAVMLHFSIPTLAERKRMIDEAEAERERIDRNPDLLKGPSELELALESLRARHRRGDPISDDEILEADRAMREDDDEKTAAW